MLTARQWGSSIPYLSHCDILIHSSLQSWSSHQPNGVNMGVHGSFIHPELSARPPARTAVFNTSSCFQNRGAGLCAFKQHEDVICKCIRSTHHWNERSCSIFSLWVSGTLDHQATLCTHDWQLFNTVYLDASNCWGWVLLFFISTSFIAGNGK